MRVNVTIPVLNEERILERNILRLHAFLSKRCAFDWEIVIADNGSTDETNGIAGRLTERCRNVQVLRLEERGRGRALKKVWLDSAADVLSYMDVDLSTDLEAFPALVEPLVIGHFDLATGSRLHGRSVTTRSFRREMLSRGYNVLVEVLFRPGFSDAQCGFKAIRRESALELLPLVQDTGWFFDSELLLFADRLGYRVLDVPVRWVEAADSRVKILPTCLALVLGLRRMRRALAAGCALPTVRASRHIRHRSSR